MQTTADTITEQGNEWCTTADEYISAFTTRKKLHSNKTIFMRERKREKYNQTYYFQIREAFGLVPCEQTDK